MTSLTHKNGDFHDTIFLIFNAQYLSYFSTDLFFYYYYFIYIFFHLTSQLIKVLVSNMFIIYRALPLSAPISKKDDFIPLLGANSFLLK